MSIGVEGSRFPVKHRERTSGRNRRVPDTGRLVQQVKTGWTVTGRHTCGALFN